MTALPGLDPDLEVLFPDPTDGEPRAALWRSPKGVLHRAVGAKVHRDVPRLMWTACGSSDIPANAAWLAVWGEKEPNCPDCKAWEEREGV